MMDAYAPKFRKTRHVPDDVVAAIDARVEKYYSDRGVESEIARGDKGFFLKMFVRGDHIGGLQQLPGALKFNG